MTVCSILTRSITIFAVNVFIIFSSSHPQDFAVTSTVSVKVTTMTRDWFKMGALILSPSWWSPQLVVMDITMVISSSYLYIPPVWLLNLYVNLHLSDLMYHLRRIKDKSSFVHIVKCNEKHCWINWLGKFPTKCWECHWGTVSQHLTYYWNISCLLWCKELDLVLSFHTV